MGEGTGQACDLLDLSFQRHRVALEHLPNLTKFGIERLYRVLNNLVTRHLPYPPLKSPQHLSGLSRLPLELQNFKSSTHFG